MFIKYAKKHAEDTADIDIDGELEKIGIHYTVIRPFVHFQIRKIEVTQMRSQLTEVQINFRFVAGKDDVAKGSLGHTIDTNAVPKKQLMIDCIDLLKEHGFEMSLLRVDRV